jgi:hypothetical protein
MASELSRRGFLGAAGSIGLLALAPPERVRALLAASPRANGDGLFLTAHELTTLRALTARLIPGPPDDPTPGAREAGAAEAIDLLLGAFRLRPPLIHAGGPFSNRAGARHDSFRDFVPLDRHAAAGWRIRLEGSHGRRSREFGGPVVGLQTIYRSGLAHLDARARSQYQLDFAQLPSPAQDLILSDQSDDATQAFVGAAMANTIEATYGPPEYGGNRGLAGWHATGWAGDRQPRGFSREQVTRPDPDARPLGTAAAGFALDHLAPHLAGRPAPRGAEWLGRGGLGRP